MLMFTLLVAGIVSAFMNNTPIVVMFIPVVAALAGRFGIGANTMLMPLSFIAILGGMLTLIGSSTNLLVADLAAGPLGRELRFFELFVPGSIIVAVGACYTLLVAPRLLAKKTSDGDAAPIQDGRHFIAQLDITLDHAFAGAKSIAGMFRELPGISVQMIRRKREVILPPFEDIELSPGDTIVMATTRKQLMGALNLRDHLENDATPGSDADNATEGWMIAEAAVAPGSRLSGRFLSREAFHSRTGCHVIGILRHKRMARSRLEEVRLQNGDVLLIAGAQAPISELRRDRDLSGAGWLSQRSAGTVHGAAGVDHLCCNHCGICSRSGADHGGGGDRCARHGGQSLPQHSAGNTRHQPEDRAAGCRGHRHGKRVAGNGRRILPGDGFAQHVRSDRYDWTAGHSVSARGDHDQHPVQQCDRTDLYTDCAQCG